MTEVRELLEPVHGLYWLSPERFVPMVSPLAGSRSDELHQLLAEIATLQHREESLRCGFQSFGDALAPAQSSRFYVIREFVGRVRPQVEVIGDDEPLHARALVETGLPSSERRSAPERRLKQIHPHSRARPARHSPV